jgi:GNAT superfamily N-acetyltransferase
VAQEVAEAGFELEVGTLAPFYAPALLSLAELSYHVGFFAGEPVATALAYRVDATVGVFNVATPPSRRGRGYGTALTAAAARGGEPGPELAWLQASEPGEPVYRRMGFRTVETYNLFTRA